jgi:hypothetical protein
MRTALHSTATAASRCCCCCCALQILASLPALQNAFLRYTGLDGPLSCDLVSNPSLTRLSISGNNVTGELPACMLQVGQVGCIARLIVVLEESLSHS